MNNNTTLIYAALVFFFIIYMKSPKVKEFVHSLLDWVNDKKKEE